MTSVVYSKDTTETGVDDMTMTNRELYDVICDASEFIDSLFYALRGKYIEEARKDGTLDEEDERVFNQLWSIAEMADRSAITGIPLTFTK